MKIIQIMPEFGLAGAEIMCENLIYELRGIGYEVIVISMYDYHSAITERLEAKGIEIRYLDKKIGFDVSMISKMKKEFDKLKPDIIHTHRNCAQYAIPAAILSNIKCRVHTVHNIAKKENIKFARILNKVFSKKCGLKLVALSKNVQDSIVEEYNISSNEVPIVFNGINLEKCIPKISYKKNDIFKILHIGRFSEQKNHIGLLEAFEKFHGLYPDTKLQLIGDGEMRNEIMVYVNKKGLDNAVEFLGLQDNVYYFLNNADIFVLPSLYEGMPMTLIEAMGTGLPIITTLVGGIPDMLDENNAILVLPKVEDIVGSFEKMYLDENLREKLGRNAKEHSVIFSARKMAIDYHKIYEKLNGNKI